MSEPLLQAKEVTKRFRVGGGVLPGSGRTLEAVSSVSLAVARGETLGLVGESGCGKSTLGRCLTRLYDLSSGSMRFAGEEIGDWPERRLRPLRPRLQMVFQDPAGSLNPRRRIGDLIAEPLRIHHRGNPAEIAARIRELLRLTGLSVDHIDRYPHEFSGGQRQRIGIARALALGPELVVADEPVSALDVSVQAQIVNLLLDLRERLGLTMIFIAHDLAVVRQIATRVAVMYLGRIVETAATDDLYAAPAHPYTAALLSAVPVARVDGARRERIILKGDVPSPLDPPSGCPFHPRCAYADTRCRTEPPRLRDLGQGRTVACHYPRPS